MKIRWQTKTLGEVCKTGAGGTPLKANKEYYEGGTIPWLMSGEVSQGEIWAATNFITQKGLENSSARLFPPNTVLIAMYGATAGQVGILKFEAATNQAVCGILPNKQFIPEFLFYLMLSKKDELVAQATGNAQPNISQIKIRNTNVPLAPLPEQQRIVGILDDTFDGITTAKANAEKNLLNARALFESQLNTVFSQRGEGWVETPLETVASILNGYAFKSTDFSPKKGVKCIKITNVGVREFVPESDGYLPDSFAGEYEKVSVKTGSIVLALTRTIIAGGLKVAVVPDEYNGALLNQRVASIITDDKHLNGAFLFAYLSTQTVVDYVKERVNTLMQPNLSIMDLRSMPIPVPLRSEQNKITEQFDELRTETGRLAAIYDQKLSALETLKKSLLHQAFTGEL